MRISLYSGSTLYPLAGQTGVSERVHSSAGNVTITPQAALQVVGRVRATHAMHLDRGNLATSISFSTSRKFATVAAAEQWALAYDAAFPREGTLWLDTVSPLGVVTRQTLATAVVSPPKRTCTGATVLIDYQVQGGVIAAWAGAAPGSIAVAGSLDSGAGAVVFPELLPTADPAIWSSDGAVEPGTGIWYSLILTLSVWRLMKATYSGGLLAGGDSSWDADEDVLGDPLQTLGFVPNSPATGTPVLTLNP